MYARLARCCKLPTPTATEQEFDTNLVRYGTKLEKGARPSIGTYVRVLPLLCCALGILSHLSKGRQAHFGTSLHKWGSTVKCMRAESRHMLISR